jgi:hypothetical protein
MSSTRSVRQLSEATTELLEAVYSMGYVQRWYKQDKPTIYLSVTQSPASMGVNTEAQKTTALEAITRRQPVKI